MQHDYYDYLEISTNSLNKAIVITNNFFTKSAIKLAEANGVVLCDRNILKEKVVYLNQ